MTLEEEDSATLHYLRGRVDSLFEITETHIAEETVKEVRLRRVENQLFAMWVLGPALTIAIGAIYTLQKLLV